MLFLYPFRTLGRKSQNLFCTNVRNASLIIQQEKEFAFLENKKISIPPYIEGALYTVRSIILYIRQRSLL